MDLFIEDKVMNLLLGKVLVYSLINMKVKYIVDIGKIINIMVKESLSTSK